MGILNHNHKPDIVSHEEALVFLRQTHYKGRKYNKVLEWLLVTDFSKKKKGLTKPPKQKNQAPISAATSDSIIPNSMRAEELTDHWSQGKVQTRRRIKRWRWVLTPEVQKDFDKDVNMALARLIFPACLSDTYHSI